MSRIPIVALTPGPSPQSGEDPIVRLRRASPPAPEGAPLSPLSLSLAAGDSHFLVGRPGAGKTAFLEMIAMAAAPANGAVELFGEDLQTVRPRDRFRLRRRIGLVFQDLRLIDSLSVFDNVALAARAAGRAPADYGRDVDEVLAWVGLARGADQPADHLNEEGRRRLAVARAVINRPDVVLADEPAGSVGLPILKLLSDLNLAGTAVLIATADEDLAERSGADVTRLSRFAAAVRPGDLVSALP